MIELTDNFPSILFLFAVQMLAVLLAVRHAKRRGWSIKATGIYFVLGLLGLWGALSVWLALTGIYMSAIFLAAYPTFWLPFIPVILALVPLLASGSLRTAVAALIDATPTHWIIGIHALRILAIGSLIKAWNGAFSMSFAIWVGIPDLLFGVSALVMYWMARQGRVSSLGLMVWNALGVLVIIPGAPLVAQAGLPGAFFRSNETPSMMTLYEFPMVLAPSLVVPVFVLFNLIVAAREFTKRPQRPTQTTKAASGP